MAYGDITLRDNLNRMDIGTQPLWCAANGNYWALVYKTSSEVAFTVETYEVNPATGDIGALIDSHNFTWSNDGAAMAEQISEGVVAIWWRDRTNFSGRLTTIGISTSGVINTTELATIEWLTTTAGSGDRVERTGRGLNIAGDVWLFPYIRYTPTLTSNLATVSISGDGLTLSAIDNAFIANGYNESCNTVHVAGTIYATSFDRLVVTSDVSDAGTITTAVVDSTSFANAQTRGTWVVRLGNGWFIVSHGNEPLTEGRTGSLHISDAGTVDAAFTDIIQFTLNNAVLTVCGDLGTDGTTSYLCIVSTNSDNDDQEVFTQSVDSGGNLVNLQNDVWITGLIAPAFTRLVPIAYNMFMVSTDNGAALDIYSRVIEFNTPGSVFPTDVITRVTAITHRYDRAKQIYNMELTLGNVISDFGLPEWSSRPQSAAVEQEEKIDKAPETSTSYGPRVEELVHGPLPRELDTIKPSAIEPSAWSKITPWKEEEGETMLSSAIARTKAQLKKESGWFRTLKKEAAEIKPWWRIW